MEDSLDTQAGVVLTQDELESLMHVQSRVEEGDIINGPPNDGTVLVSQNVRRGEDGEAFVELTFQQTDHDAGIGVPFVKQTVVLSGSMLVQCSSVVTETFTRQKAQED